MQNAVPRVATARASYRQGPEEWRGRVRERYVPARKTVPVHNNNQTLYDDTYIPILASIHALHEMLKLMPLSIFLGTRHMAERRPTVADHFRCQGSDCAVRQLVDPTMSSRNGIDLVPYPTILLAAESMLRLHLLNFFRW